MKIAICLHVLSIANEPTKQPPGVPLNCFLHTYLRCSGCSEYKKLEMTTCKQGPNDLRWDPRVSYLVLFTGGVVRVIIWSAHRGVFASIWGTTQKQRGAGWSLLNPRKENSSELNKQTRRCQTNWLWGFSLAWGRPSDAWQAAVVSLKLFTKSERN